MALSEQVPTISGFHRKSTGDEVLAEIDLKGKTAIVTGGYSGIGLETTRSLAKRGARVIVPVRSEKKAKESLQGLDGVETAPLDLAELSSVQRFVHAVSGELTTLDLLINNAGIMA